MRVRGEMQASRIRYLGSCWDEKRFKGETLLLLFNSSMRNKNISYFDTILLTEMNLINLIDKLKVIRIFMLNVMCFFFTLYFSQQRYEYLYVFASPGIIGIL